MGRRVPGGSSFAAGCAIVSDDAWKVTARRTGWGDAFRKASGERIKKPHRIRAEHCLGQFAYALRHFRIGRCDQRREETLRSREYYLPVAGEPARVPLACDGSARRAAHTSAEQGAAAGSEDSNPVVRERRLADSGAPPRSRRLGAACARAGALDRKSTRLNSSHV